MLKKMPFSQVVSVEGQERQAQCTSSLSMMRVGTLKPLGLSRKVPSGVAHLQARGTPSPGKSGPGPARLCTREGRRLAEAGVPAGLPRNLWAGGWLRRQRWAASREPAGAAHWPFVTSSAPACACCPCGGGGQARAPASPGEDGRWVPEPGLPLGPFQTWLHPAPRGHGSQGTAASLLSSGRTVSSGGERATAAVEALALL